MVPAGVDEHHAIGTLGTVKGRAVAQYLDAFYVGRRDIGQDVVEESVVKHRPPVLLVEDDAVDDDERLGVGVDGTQTVDEHHTADARRAAAGHGMHLRAQLLLYVVLDAHRVGELEA